MGFYSRFIKNLCNCSRLQFEISIWHRILFIEIVHQLFVDTRAILYLTSKGMQHQPYWEYCAAFLLIVKVIFFPLKMYLLLSGIMKRNSKQLQTYAKINPILVPIVTPIQLYICLSTWNWQGTMLSTAIEISVLVFTCTIGVWGIFWVVPKHARKLDTSTLKKLETYITNLSEIPEKIETNDYYESEVEVKIVEPAIVIEEMKAYFISPLNISIDKSDIVGEGQFGRVYKGQLLLKNKDVVVDVAAKSTKESEPNLSTIVQEIKISMHVGYHPHVVHFFGVSSDPLKDSFYLISEYCSEGGLNSYLDKLRQIHGPHIQSPSIQYVNLDSEKISSSVKDLTTELQRMSKEVCEGMAHLASKNIIHGDLSTRNVLLSEDMSVKICDFGMSNRLYNYQLYTKQLRQNMLPWRWMSPEALEDLRFSEKSDIWSFGVTLWEIFSLGQIPYGDMTWSTDILTRLRSQEMKLSQPELAHDKIYEMMQNCWKLENRDRPTFKNLQETFKNFSLQ